MCTVLFILTYKVYNSSENVCLLTAFGEAKPVLLVTFALYEYNLIFLRLLYEQIVAEMNHEESKMKRKLQNASHEIVPIFFYVTSLL